MDTSKAFGGTQPRAFKRIAVIIFAFTASAGLMFALFAYTPETHIQKITKAVGLPYHAKPIPPCGSFAGSSEIWEQSQLKYEKTRDDKFTIAMQTYQRPKELNDTLHGLLSEPIPSLHEVVIVWNDLETKPPANYISTHGVPVRYRHSKHNSLNEKLYADPAYETQAIFLSDDDMYFKPKDLEFVFQSWRSFGKWRMTGGFARCSVKDDQGQWKYSFCSKEEGTYNMILSGLAFAHISFLDFYSSSDVVAKQVRDYVDEHFNCEDIAINYFAALLTGEAPLLVKGKEPFVSYVPKDGISTKPGHLEARTKCLNDYNKMFQCMPLKSATAHIEPGVIVS